MKGGTEGGRARGKIREEICIQEACVLWICSSQHSIKLVGQGIKLRQHSFSPKIQTGGECSVDMWWKKGEKDERDQWTGLGNMFILYIFNYAKKEVG